MIQTKKKVQRQERILSTLANLTYATREQLQEIEMLGGDRNARRILLEMENDKLIGSIRREKKIYFLTNRGSDQICRTKSRLKKSQITHTLMRNDLYIRLGMPSDWKKEVPIRMNDEVVLIADAMFSKSGQFHFVEIDNKQSMRTNNDKIKKYKDVFELIYKEYGHHAILIWYTLSDVRKKRLKESCEKQGIKNIIY